MMDDVGQKKSRPGSWVGRLLPRSIGRWMILVSLSALALAVAVQGRSRVSTPVRITRVTPVPLALTPIAVALDDSLIHRAPDGIDERFLIRARTGIDEAMIVAPDVLRGQAVTRLRVAPPASVRELPRGLPQVAPSIRLTPRR